MNPTPNIDTQRLRELLAASPDWEHLQVMFRFPDDEATFRALRNEAPALLDEVERLRMEIKAERQKSKVLGGIADGRLEEIRAIKGSVVDEIGGVDFEGNPTSEINYLQRLRILLKAESERDSLRRENEELKAKLR